MKNNETEQQSPNVKELGAQLIAECGDDVALLVELHREASLKKAKAKSEQEFANTLSALRAKINFPSKISDKDRQTMAAHRIMAWYLRTNHPEYKIKIPKAPKPKLSQEEVDAKKQIKATIQKLKGEGKSFQQVKDYFKQKGITVKSQTISMTMNPANKKNKPNTLTGKAAASASESISPQEKFLAKN